MIQKASQHADGMHLIFDPNDALAELPVENASAVLIHRLRRAMDPDDTDAAHQKVCRSPLYWFGKTGTPDYLTKTQSSDSVTPPGFQNDDLSAQINGLSIARDHDLYLR